MITLYFSDHAEYQTLLPLKSEFENRGYKVKFSKNFDEPSEIGVYACHTNFFFDPNGVGWRKPPCKFSVICLHDFYHDNGQRSNMFLNDSWSIFDLALVPGSRWRNIYHEGLERSIAGPKYGVREVGWPISDDAINGWSSVGCDRKKLELGLDPLKKTVLLGASWQTKAMIQDCLAHIDFAKYNLIVKSIDWDHYSYKDSPWRDIFEAQHREGKLSLDFARNMHINLAPFDINISELMCSIDVVLSNGSNIMFEALLHEKPSICIREWSHPYGSRGQFKYYPSVDMEGIINGSKKNLNELIESTLSIANSPILKLGKSLFVNDRHLGKGAKYSADAILAAYQGADNLEAEWLPAAEKLTSELDVIQKKLLADVENQFDETNILHLNNKLKYLWFRVIELEKEVARVIELEKEVASLTNRLSDVLNSNSWLITRPLRFIRRRLAVLTKNRRKY